MTAYGVKTFQISGPAWMDTERFDIVATLPSSTTQEQCRTMLQNLLVERFRIALHRETRELPMYSLTVAKGGPKMKESTKDAVTPKDDAEPAATPSRPKMGTDGFVALEELPAWAPISIITRPDRAHMMGRQKTTEELADRLTAVMGRPVIDATGLKGKYDFAFNYAPEGMTATTGSAPPTETAEAETLPDISHVLQAELGLKLEARKDLVKMIVIDHVEKTPSEK